MYFLSIFDVIWATFIFSAHKYRARPPVYQRFVLSTREVIPVSFEHLYHDFRGRKVNNGERRELRRRLVNVGVGNIPLVSY